MWTLVFIVLIGTEVDANIVGNYESMYDCFDDREQLAVTAGGTNGYFPEGMQAVCVYRETSGV